MGVQARYPHRVATAAALALPLLLVASCATPPPPQPPPSISFQYQGPESGIDRHSTTYSIAVSDLDGDADDDLLVGNHGSPPTLYLNTGQQGRFVEQSVLLGIGRHRDRHGFTVVDIDNDGDRDILYAGGGADGVGRGLPNGVHNNLLAQTGQLAFEDVTQGSDTGPRTMRARHFFPIASASGEHVEFYLTSLHKRRATKNLYIANRSQPGDIKLVAVPDSPLNLGFESEGKDLFFDFDRDGLTDYLHVGAGRTMLLRNDGDAFVHMPSAIDDLDNVVSAVTADLNNDGFPDLYLGSSAGNGPRVGNSDQFSHTNSRLHFSVARHYQDTVDAIVITSPATQMAIDFVYHVPQVARRRVDVSDIYLGARAINPSSRRAVITASEAAGKPVSMAKAGTYIWHDAVNSQWHVHWRHDRRIRFRHKGVIELQPITHVSPVGLEKEDPEPVRDYVLLNEGGNSWRQAGAPMREHDKTTNYLAAADFNNDGLVDIAGTRAGDEAELNGVPFILLNRGDMQFTAQSLPVVEAERIYRGDIIVHGFFNGDRLPDIFYSNGHGLKPLASGPYSLWLNTTATSHDALVLSLQGAGANRDAIGAQLELYDADKALMGYRELGANFGRGQGSALVHFGLGDKPAPFLLRITWPGGSRPQEVSFESGGIHRIMQASP